jgi:hypothetical protein
MHKKQPVLYEFSLLIDHLFWNGRRRREISDRVGRVQDLPDKHRLDTNTRNARILAAVDIYLKKEHKCGLKCFLFLSFY